MYKCIYTCLQSATTSTPSSCYNQTGICEVFHFCTSLYIKTQPYYNEVEKIQHVQYNTVNRLRMHVNSTLELVGSCMVLSVQGREVVTNKYLLRENVVEKLVLFRILSHGLSCSVKTLVIVKYILPLLTTLIWQLLIAIPYVQLTTYQKWVLLHLCNAIIFIVGLSR